MYAFEFKNVKKSFRNGTFILDLPKLQVEEGYVTGFVGENGAGKSTTIKLLMNHFIASEGEIYLYGKNIKEDGWKTKDNIAYVGDETGYMEQAKLKYLLKMVKPFYSIWDNKIFDRLIDRFSLDLNSTHKSLSKGQKKQFALAMALAHHPKLILLDEPTANLDALVRDEILNLLSEKLEQEGVSIFFSTHITSDLDKIADNLVFLSHGKIYMEGSKDGLIERHTIVKGRKELLCEDVRKLFVNCEENEFGFCALTDRSKQARDFLGIEAIYEKPSVEDVFLSYAKRERRGDQ